MADIISRLRLESGEFDSKIKRAGQELLAYSEHCRKTGLQMGFANRDAREFAQSLGDMRTTATTARGKLGELTAAFTDLSVMYRQMTDEEKRNQFGKNLSASLDRLKERIMETRTELADVQNELNGTASDMGGLSAKGMDLSGILNSVGGQLGINTQMLSGLSAGTLGTAGAVGVLVAAWAKGIEVFKSYNDEMSKQTEVTRVTTQLRGPEADEMVAAARSVAKVYDTDFREVINAANTLMTQFGKSGEDAMSLIRDGMQGMVRGDGGKLLSMIQQYAPSFRDAGIEASQLVAIIQNSEGGIFTDQNMNAIVMGIKNLRLMTKSTSDALSQLGIDGVKMTKQLSDGTLTIFDAMRQVASAIEMTESGSQAAGEVMQQVFGRQGAMAGTKLGEAIATLNTNLSETREQTGKLGQSLAKLEQANEELEKAFQRTFAVDGWDEMTNVLESGLVTALADVVNCLGAVNEAIDGVGDAFNSVFGGGGGALQLVADLGVALSGPLGLLKDIVKYTKMLTGAGGETAEQQASADVRRNVDTRLANLRNRKEGERANYYAQQLADIQSNIDRSQSAVSRLSGKMGHGGGDARQRERLRELLSINEKYRQELELYSKEGGEFLWGKEDAPTTKTDPPRRTGGNGGSSKTKQEELTLQQQIAKLEEEAYTATEARREEIAAQVKEMDKELERQKKIRESLHGSVGDQSQSGVSIRTQNGLQQYIADVKKQLGDAEIGSAVFERLSAQLSDLTALQNVVGESLKIGLGTAFLDVADETGANFWTRAMVGGVENADWQAVMDRLNKKRREMGMDDIVMDFGSGSVHTSKKDKDEKKEEKKKEAVLAKEIGSMAGGISSMVGGLEQLGVDIPDGLKNVVGGIQGVASILTSIMTVVSAIEVIAGADTLIPFANGGVVRAAGGTVAGTHYSGDVTPILANAGEVVLNKAQTQSLAHQLDGGGGVGVGQRMQPYVMGEQIFLGMNNTSRRMGRGEIVTTGTLRRLGLM